MMKIAKQAPPRAKEELAPLEAKAGYSFILSSPQAGCACFPSTKPLRDSVPLPVSGRSFFLRVFPALTIKNGAALASCPLTRMVSSFSFMSPFPEWEGIRLPKSLYGIGVALLATLAIGGCGDRRDLSQSSKAQISKANPSNSTSSSSTTEANSNRPTANQLLETSVESRPQRQDELLLRSARRTSDPFAPLPNNPLPNNKPPSDKTNPNMADKKE